MTEEQEYRTADTWWQELSINEMKALAEKYYPYYSWYLLRPSHVHEIWKKEHA